MAFHLLERDRKGGLAIVDALQAALAQVGNCQHCSNLSEQAVCQICRDPKRDASQLCILETPADVIAIEQTGCFRGHYFVLGGHLSPIDGIGPKDIGIDRLTERLQSQIIQEIILATNLTVEGEATAYYIAELARPHGVKTTRIAYGVPLGGELEYVDGATLSRALEGRSVY
jgi:recombination protein RecR